MFKKIKDIAKTDALWLAVITTGICLLYTSFTVMESFTDRLKVRSEIGKGTTVIMTKYLDIISGI